jgi:hypothetical protein
MTHTHESEEVIEALRQKLVGVRTCIDIGSGDAYELCKLDCERKIAIDAHPYIGIQIEGIEFHNIGIAEVSGKAPFWHGPDWGCSSLNNRGGEEFLIDVITLDEFVAKHEIKDVDALIIDTEGTTWQVLQGAKKVLETVKYIYAEVQLTEIYPYPRCRLGHEVSVMLEEYGLKMVTELPSYNAWPQANILYARV